jgi:hypothetical protein
MGGSPVNAECPSAPNCDAVCFGDCLDFYYQQVVYSYGGEGCPTNWCVDASTVQQRPCGAGGVGIMMTIHECVLTSDPCNCDTSTYVDTGPCQRTYEWIYFCVCD